MICFVHQPSQVTAQQLISTMSVFVQVNAAQIVTVREVRNVVVMAVVVSAVLPYDKVNTELSCLFLNLFATPLFVLVHSWETLVLPLILKQSSVS